MLKKLTQTSNLFVERANTLESRRGYMFPSALLPSLEKERDAGFRSVYMFGEEDSKRAMAAQSSKGFGRLNVYSDCLFIDLDGGDKALADCLSKLPYVGYEVYTSGSKGYHIHIPHDTYEGPIPEAHREWVAAHGLPHDVSIYRRSSLIALPGRIHPKTKLKKRLIMAFNGPQPEFWEPTLASPKEVEGLGDATDVLLRAARMMEVEPVSGWRHTSLWSLAQSMAEAGFSQETALEIALKINGSWKCQKDPSEVSRAVSQAYR